jgi:protease-4
MLNQIAEARLVPVEKLNAFADSLLLWDPARAISYNMMDTFLYRDQVLDTLARLSEIENAKDLHFVTHQKYLKVRKPKDEKGYTRNKIAVIYAEGNIVSGDPGEGNIGSESLSKTIRDARRDSTIKAIVFRVNSGGGSALASEIIWREIYLTRKVKPVIASLGDIAASGGYYIVTAADTIVTGPNTITGSIGVFGLLMDASGFFKNKLGITTDVEKTNAYSDFGSIFRPLTGTERNTLQKLIDQIYTTFVNRVADGRNLSYETVDLIAEGRVWSGTNATELKLADVTGGLSKAIELAAGRAKLDHYKITELPRLEDPLSQIMKELSGEISGGMLRNELGTSYTYFQHMKNLISGDRIQARLPFEISVH